MSPIPSQSTPFPNALIDRVMPTLKDTEWRLLCIIVRQTLGWQEVHSPARKTQDWLTQRQLMQRTGRASAAVSHAIDALVQRNLIEVVTETGDVLSTPQERRQWAGHLLFRLASNVVAKYAQEKYQGGDEETSSSESTQGCLKSKVRKTNTTKETENKITPNGVMPRIFSNRDRWIGGIPIAPDGDVTLKSTSSPDPDVRRFLLLYRDLFARKSPRGEMPYIMWGRDGKLAQQLLKQYGYDRLVELLRAYFETEDAWVRKCGYALACFPTVLPLLLMAGVKSEDSLRRVPARPIVLHSPSDQHWQQASDNAGSTSLSARFPDLAEKLRHLSP